MKKALFAAIVTLVVGILVMSIFPDAAELGVLAAVAVMGAFIIYFNDKNK